MRQVPGAGVTLRSMDWRWLLAEEFVSWVEPDWPNLCRLLWPMNRNLLHVQSIAIHWAEAGFSNKGLLVRHVHAQWACCKEVGTLQRYTMHERMTGTACL